MSQCWNDDMFRGIKVEIINANTEITAYAVYWIAVVINVQGIQSLLFNLALFEINPS